LRGLPLSHQIPSARTSVGLSPSSDRCLRHATRPVRGLAMEAEERADRVCRATGNERLVRRARLNIYRNYLRVAATAADARWCESSRASLEMKRNRLQEASRWSNVMARCVIVGAKSTRGRRRLTASPASYA